MTVSQTNGTGTVFNAAEIYLDFNNDTNFNAADGDVRALQSPHRVLAKVVAVHGDVQRAYRYLRALDLGDALRQAVGERDASGRDPKDDEIVGALVALEQLVGHPGHHPGDLWCFQHRAGTRHRSSPSPPHRTGR